MKYLLTLALVLIGGFSYANNCHVQQVQRIVHAPQQVVVERIVVPQRIVQYAEVPQYQVVQQIVQPHVQAQVFQRVIVQDHAQVQKIIKVERRGLFGRQVVRQEIRIR